MKTIIRLRWILLALWVAAAVLLSVLQPDINKLIHEKGQGTLGEKYPSQIAQKLLSSMSSDNGLDAILVFTSKEKLAEKDMEAVKEGLESLKENKAELGIVSVVDSFEYPEAQDQLVSEDGTTIIASIKYQTNGRESKDVLEDIEKRLETVDLEHYVTGGESIKNDFMKATFEGVDKSAIITIVFILLVLLLVFRSVATPLISLATVGISYLCSMGIVSQLIYNFGFPVTSLTQMFLVLVLFGIGTDYNILLLNRFKEELALNDTVDEAIIKTYKTAGKTILFSGLTIFIAFASLSFSEFDVYRSGISVAVGILVLFLELMTLMPMVMKLMGKKLFWPAHDTTGHKESKLWEKVSSAAVKHPIIPILAICAAMIPVILFNSQKLSFDNLKEMDKSYPSVKGFSVVSDHFNKGKTMPTTVVLKNEKAMDNNEALAAIDKLNEKILSVEGVKEVAGPTRPKGMPIDEFYTGQQTKTVVDGLTATGGGVEKINDGLEQMKEKLAAPDFSKVGEMAKGTGGIQNGLAEITKALKQIESGIGSGAAGAEAISDGVSKVKANLELMGTSTEQLWKSYAQLQGGYVTFGENYKNIAGQLENMQTALTAIVGLVGGLEQNHKELAADQSFGALKKYSSELDAGMKQLTAGMNQLNIKYEEATKGFAAANDGLKKISDGQGQMAKGLESLISGTRELSNGLKKGSAGQAVIVANMEKLTAGLGELKDGQEKLNSGLSDLGSGMEQLKNGLGASADGLEQISTGLEKTSGFLSQMTVSKTFFLPKEALESADFKKSLDAYMSEDRKTVKLTVTLSDDPYSPKAIETVEKINNMIAGQLKGTPLANATFGTAGETSTTNDLNQVATNDISKTQIIVIIGVFLVLLLVIREFWTPVFIIASLMAAYYASITVTGLVATKIFKLDGVSWNVPFFSFIMIVALGVDYSIFLMMRYKEYGGITPREAIVKAAKNIGGVVVSAAIILAGTFLTLYPSGIQVMMQMAISVSFGLMLLCLVFLPVAIPALISLHDLLTGKRKTKVKSESPMTLMEEM